MALYTIQSEDEPVDPSKWTDYEKDRYRFGGFKYSMRGREYPRKPIPQIKGLYGFPSSDGSPVIED